MLAGNPDKVQSAINVTPLVDVVLVLLIIFMVVVPQMHAGPDVKLPTTEQPKKEAGDGLQVVVAIERSGTIWIDSDLVSAEAFSERMRAAAEAGADRKVVIKGDARLSYGEVMQAMLVVEDSGFREVGLVAQRRDELTRGE